MKTLAVVLTALLLTGCAHTVFDPLACPTIEKYTKAEQTQFLNDIGKSTPPIQRAMEDYLRLRDKARACQNAGR